MLRPTLPLATSPLRVLAPLAALSLLACAMEAPPACEGEGCAEPLESLRLTYLDVQYDLSQPVYINNRVPIEYGLTGTSLGETVTTQAAVTFSFVEASPEDPAAPIECSSSAAVVELPGDGEEHRFYGYVWPTTACEALLGREVNVRVEFDGGDELDTTADSPSVSFTEANRGEEPNQRCVTASGEAGCVYSFDLQPTPSDDSGALIDVRHAAVQSPSSVALLPVDEAAPTLAIESTLVVNGRDPYIAAVDPEAVPADLVEAEPGIVDDLQFGLDAEGAARAIAMPGNATIRYEIRPSGSTDEFLALRVGVRDSESGERADVATITELLPGTPNLVSHELFAEGATRAALGDAGIWRQDTDFEVRGCFEADFTQAGNAGSSEDAGDCRSVELVLVRESESTAAATAHQFNHRFERSVGNSRIGLEAALETENRMDSTGASSRVEGNVTVRGNIGRSFSLDIVRARAQATAGLDAAANGYEVSLVAFNQTVFEISESGGEVTREQEFSVAKSFDLPNLGYGFGPVRIGITISLGGELGLRMDDTLFSTTDAERCADTLGASDLAGCAAISRTTTPFFAFTARVFGGVRIGPVSGGVEANLRLINTEFPLVTSLGVGIDDGGAISVLGNANFGLELRLVQGDVAIVGRIRFRRRFLRRFNRTLRVNLFSFESPLIRRTLFDRSLELEVLQ